MHHSHMCMQFKNVVFLCECVKSGPCLLQGAGCSVGSSH